MAEYTHMFPVLLRTIYLMRYAKSIWQHFLKITVSLKYGPIKFYFFAHYHFDNSKASDRRSDYYDFVPFPTPLLFTYFIIYLYRAWHLRSFHWSDKSWGWLILCCKSTAEKINADLRRMSLTYKDFALNLAVEGRVKATVFLANKPTQEVDGNLYLVI